MRKGIVFLRCFPKIVTFAYLLRIICAKFQGMKHRLLLTLLLCFALGARAQWVIEDPVVDVRTLESEFSSIQVEGNLELYLIPNDSVILALSGSKPSVIEGIETRVEAGTLYIAGGRTKKQTARVYVGFKNLVSLEASGAVDVIGSMPWVADSMAFRLSGQVNLKAEVKLRVLNIQLSGASDAILNGDVQSMQVHCSGASDLTGPDLMVTNCDARASGASDIEISFIDHLKARATGVSRIMYHNKPTTLESFSSPLGSVFRVVKQ